MAAAAAAAGSIRCCSDGKDDWCAAPSPSGLWRLLLLQRLLLRTVQRLAHTMLSFQLLFNSCPIREPVCCRTATATPRFSTCTSSKWCRIACFVHKPAHKRLIEGVGVYLACLPRTCAGIAPGLVGQTLLAAAESVRTGGAGPLIFAPNAHQYLPLQNYVPIAALFCLVIVRPSGADGNLSSWAL